MQEEAAVPEESRKVPPASMPVLQPLEAGPASGSAQQQSVPVWPEGTAASGTLQGNGTAPTRRGRVQGQGVSTLARASARARAPTFPNSCAPACAQPVGPSSILAGPWTFVQNQVREKETETSFDAVPLLSTVKEIMH
ncbi:hypothetical protein HJG60_010781 [Phyllostomus discolor]|uniref:Uncharacterized protein n=1 Tax=Phyllostomus discolor TaxID=89673 RepID=A0A834ADG5_9CHIR|nr:hypothetical protein HJG60_010781 [Phyllostomus discolor]